MEFLLKTKHAIYTLFFIAFLYVIAQSSTLEEDNSPKSTQEYTNKKLPNNQNKFVSAPEKLNSKEPIENLILHLSPPLIPNIKTYNTCVKLSDSVISFLPLKPELNQKVINSLHRCRTVRNQFDSTPERIDVWKKLKDIIEEEGWQAIIYKIERGEISINFALQAGEPAHNLPILFLQANVIDTDAFEKLANYGVKFNSKFLSTALLKGNQAAIDFYLINHAQEYDDLFYTPVMQAARFGSFEDIDRFLTLGFKLHGPLQRNPIVAYLKRDKRFIQNKKLASVINRHQISFSKTDISELTESGISEDTLNLLLKDNYMENN